MKKFQNPIKWSGSKAYCAERIIEVFPSKIATFYEPFCGSCAVTLELLSNPSCERARKTIERYVCSDLNEDLINLWQTIKDKPLVLIAYYKGIWGKFNDVKPNIWSDVYPQPTLVDKRKMVFNTVREQFNKHHHSCTFLFLLRTAYNGLVRYNGKGEYNSPCHFTRQGIEPAKLKKIILNTSELLNRYDVQFVHQPYTAIKPNIGDYLFLDPPYSGGENKKPSAMYYGGFDEDEFVEWCNKLPQYALTYNGIRDDQETHKLFCKLHNAFPIALEATNSSFSKLKGKNIKVKELFYVVDNQDKINNKFLKFWTK